MLPPPTSFFDPYFRVIHLPLIFFLGACMGSFFNVCIYRIPRDLSLSFPGSHCYSCGRPVRWFDNIPLLSYWILRGHCRHCGASFSMRYFAVELLTAVLYTAAFLKLGYSLALVPALIFISLLLIATFTDIDHWIIPDRISLGGLVGGLALAAVWPLGLAHGSPLASSPFFSAPPHLLPLINALAGALIGFSVMYGIGALGSAVFHKEAMGWGDIKLFAMFGAFVGPEPLLYILILACLVGSIVGIGGIFLGKLAAGRPVAPAVAPLAPSAELAERLAAAHPLGEPERLAVLRALTQPGAVGTIRHHLPFGPSLALAAVIVYFYGPEISRWFAHLMLGPSGMGGY